MAASTPAPVSSPSDGTSWFSPRVMLDGARAVLPLTIGVFPFGLAYGVAVVASSIDDLAGVLASFLIIAGAAQLAMLDLIDAGAPWFVIVTTALVINARFMMYSGALAPAFSEFPRRWRIPLAHLMTDQATVASLLYFRGERGPRRRTAFYAGAATSFAASWVAGTLLGVVIGAAVPEELQVGFAVPLMFVALAVPTIRDRATSVAAVVGFSVTLMTRDAPLNTSLLIGAASGIAFGMLAKVLWSAPAEPSSDAPTDGSSQSEEGAG